MKETKKYDKGILKRDTDAIAEKTRVKKVDNTEAICNKKEKDEELSVISATEPFCEMLEELSPISTEEFFCTETGDGSVEILRYTGDEKYEEFIVPRKINGKLVTKIGKEAFRGYPMNKLVLQEGITHIEWSAFEGCRQLSEVVLPKSLVRIGERAFKSCGIKKLELPSGVKEIGDEAFIYNDYLSWVVFNCKKATIGDSCFKGCLNLERVDFIGKISRIGKFAFQESGIRCIKLPRGLRVIGTRAFEMCRSLESVFIPKTVISIGACAFSRYGGGINCEANEEVSIFCESFVMPFLWGGSYSWHGGVKNIYRGRKQ